MKPAKKYTFDLAASGAYLLNVAGSFFKVLSATGAFKVTGDGLDLDGLTTGSGMKGTEFSKLLFTDTSGAPNTIVVVVADAEFIDSFIGNVVASIPAGVAITSNKIAGGVPLHSSATAGVASAPLLAANANRQYFYIENKSPTETIYMRFAAGATTVNGITLLPGQFWESGAWCPTSIIHLIATAAATPLAYVEG